MKRLTYWMTAVLGALAVTFERLTAPRRAVALPNELALITEHGVETLQIDPASGFPIARQYLLYMRGAAWNYAILADGAHLPLGPSSDSPYQAGDLLSVRRLGLRKGSEIGVPSGAITIDHLVVSAAAGQVADLTLQGNGTYWVVGRCLKTPAAGATEFAYAPCTPYEITVSNGGGTYAFAGGGS